MFYAVRFQEFSRSHLVRTRFELKIREFSLFLGTLKIQTRKVPFSNPARFSITERTKFSVDVDFFFFILCFFFQSLKHGGVHAHK